MKYLIDAVSNIWQYGLVIINLLIHQAASPKARFQVMLTVLKVAMSNTLLHF